MATNNSDQDGEAATVPLTVLGGYLGAGKTTVLNHLLLHAGERRLAVMVNDFGSINIDAALIGHMSDDVIELTNGCVCCVMTNGFVAGLGALLDRPTKPDHIVVEASGVADPGTIADYGFMRGLQRDAVVVVLDAETIRARCNDRFVGSTVQRQAERADLLVLNKIDLVDNAERQRITAWLRDCAPETIVLHATHGRVSPAMLLGATRSTSHDDRADSAESWHTSSGIDHETWALTTADQVDRERLVAFLGELPSGIVRVKGIMAFAGETGSWVIQRVGSRCDIAQSPSHLDPTEPTRIVAIGQPGSIDQDGLTSAFEATLTS